MIRIKSDPDSFCTRMYFCGLRIFKIKKFKKLLEHYRVVSAELKLCKKIIKQCRLNTCVPAYGDARHVQIVCLNLLKKITAIAAANNIMYWLDFGTLIGAVRHHGFVPWDDDIDISLMRSDLVRLIPLLKAEFVNSDFFVRESCSKYFQVRIQNADNSIGVDLFPVDIIARQVTDVDTDEMLIRKIKKCRSVLEKSIKRHHNDIERVRKQILSIYGEYLNVTDHPYEGCKLFYGIDYPVCFDHPENGGLIRECDLFPLKQLAFEDATFIVPNNYERHLQNLYGNINQFPIAD